jgi:hypothetical protein
MGAWLLLDTKGEVYARDHATLEVALESDLFWRIVAWVSAVERVPELQELLPVRPRERPNCSACEGTGRIPSAARSVLCGTCSGLGWICERLPE